MSNFFKSMNVAYTENGDKAFETTENSVLDFFSMQISHNKRFNEQNPPEQILKSFYMAFNEDPEKTIRALLYRYDMREGQGERYLMNIVLKEILTHADAEHDIDLSFGKDIKTRILKKLPELGRWSTLIDVLSYYKKDMRSLEILKMIKAGLENNDTAALVAKWLPRKGETANRVRGFLKLTPKEYRKLLAQYTTTETFKSAQKWSYIDYSKVPSVCMNRSKVQFLNHDNERFNKFLVDVKAGKTKINASVLYPHDCIAKSSEAGTQEQWDALPNLFKDGCINAIPMIDVSGSMCFPIAGRITAFDVAMGLGLYIAERNESVFKDEVITFSEKPQFLKLHGSLCQRISLVRHVRNPYNTDFALAFKEILKRAKANNLSQEDMPDALFVLSDMQFDQCCDCSGVYANKAYTSLELMKKEFEEAGYKMPVMILWNLRSCGNFPTTSQQRGHILISGYSPNVLKALFNGDDLMTFTPEKYMNDLIMSERYNIFQ